MAGQKGIEDFGWGKGCISQEGLWKIIKSFTGSLKLGINIALQMHIQ